MQFMQHIVSFYVELSLSSVDVERHWITPGASFISIQPEQTDLNDVNTTSHTYVEN